MKVAYRVLGKIKKTASGKDRTRNIIYIYHKETSHLV